MAIKILVTKIPGLLGKGVHSIDSLSNSGKGRYLRNILLLKIELNQIPGGVYIFLI